MNINIDTQIQDYHECGASCGFHSLDARIKLILLFTAIALNIYFAQLWLSLALFIIGTTLAAWSRIPMRLFLVFFIIPAWSTFVIIVGFTAGFGTTQLFVLGPITFYQEGLNLGLAAAARIGCDMSWMAAVFLTTPFNTLLKALKWFRVPEVLLESIAMGYRYTSLVMQEFNTMKNSARTRGGFQNYGHALQSTGRILAQVILRAYDRAIRIQEAMISRGTYSNNTGNKDKKSVENIETACPNRCDVTPEYKDPHTPVVSCSNLAYTYGADATLHDITFTVQKKEVVVLCGPNGAGKTTLLKLLSGILSPTDGEIYLEGEHLDKKMRNLTFRHVGFLCQDPNDQLFCTHVREDVGYGPANLNLPPESITQLVNTAMELMEVSDLADRPIHRLSYGEMKRVGLAGLIAMTPPLLLLDEPSANLDPASTQQLIHHLRHLNSHHGYTFVIVTHDMNLAAQIADRIIVLDDGKIVADSIPREILTDVKLLKRSRLELPIVIKLFQRLLGDPVDRNEIPLTIDEAVAFLKDEIKVPEHQGFCQRSSDAT
ncbi:MAG: cobalt ECF transporter T component CbiQ [Desulforhopalus sp.]